MGQINPYLGGAARHRACSHGGFHTLFSSPVLANLSPTLKGGKLGANGKMIKGYMDNFHFEQLIASRVLLTDQECRCSHGGCLVPLLYVQKRVMQAATLCNTHLEKFI